MKKGLTWLAIGVVVLIVIGGIFGEDEQSAKPAKADVEQKAPAKPSQAELDRQAR
jgi:hypothetical protein